MDFPVPGSPIRRTCRFCSEAFFTTSTADSCPMTWSTSRSGILISAVLRKSWPRIHRSMTSDSSGPENVSAIGLRSHSPAYPMITGFRQLNLFATNSGPREGPWDRGRESSCGAGRDHLRELEEAHFDVLARLRAREQEVGLVALRHPLYVGLRDLRLVLQVRLVREELHGDVPGDPVHRGDPVVQLVQRVLLRDVAHRADRLGAVALRRP